MFEIMFWIFVGVLVGWNIPQPEFAKVLQTKAVEWFKGLFN